MKEVHSFKKCNLNSLSNDLADAPWGTIDAFDDVDDKWDYWKTLFLDIVSTHAPMIKVRSKQQSLRWLSNETRQLMTSQNYYLKKFRKTRSNADWECYRRLRNSIKQRLKVEKQAYFAAVCSEYSKKPKRVWKELNAALGRKANRGKIQLDTGSVIIQSPKQIASQLNSHFAPPSTSPALDLGQPPVHHTNTVFQFQPIEEEEVLLALERLNTCKATGSDGVSAYLLRTVAAVISPNITKFFNDCIVNGQTPAQWKEANVTPVPKSSSARFPSDFRPVSVIPVIAKVYESLIYKQLYTYLTTNSLLQPNQSGFRPFHSTQDALLKTLTQLTTAYFSENCSPMELKEMSTGGSLSTLMEGSRE